MPCIQYFHNTFIKNPKWQVTIDEKKCNLSGEFKLKWKWCSKNYIYIYTYYFVYENDKTHFLFCFIPPQVAWFNNNLKQI